MSIEYNIPKIQQNRRRLTDIIYIDYNEIIIKGGIIMNKTAKRIIGILVILLLWVFFICQEEMAFYGIYSLISYSVHEISTFIPYLCISAIFVWLIVTIIRMIKKQSDNKDKIFVVVLIAFLVMHIGFFYNQFQTATITTVVTVESVDLQKGTITVSNETEYGNYTIELDAPELVVNMVETNDRKYIVTYQHKYENINEGKLSTIKLQQE